MGRKIAKTIDLAYIAGFLDGDGSIMVQIKNRPSSPIGFRLMFTICFYQDTRHDKTLKWMQDILEIGYITIRKDNITELRINGYKSVKKILQDFEPHIKFKKEQVKFVLEILNLIGDKRLKDVAKEDRMKIAKLICKLRQENYFSSRRKYSDKEIVKLLNF